MGLMLAMVTVAIFADAIPLEDPNRVVLSRVLEAPGTSAWLGTDDLGRDILSRVIYGARISLAVAISSVILAAIPGTLFGLVAAVLRGRTEAIIMRVMDAILAIPALLLAIAVAAVLGSGVINVTVAIAVIYVPSFARLVYGQVLSIREREFVLASIALGASRSRVALEHILPNTSAPVVALFSLRLSSAILAESSLSFLGIGAQPPTATWGSMISQSRRFIEIAPWTVFVPGAAIFLSVFAFMVLGDALRDWLDPRARSSVGIAARRMW